MTMRASNVIHVLNYLFYEVHTVSLRKGGMLLNVAIFVNMTLSLWRLGISDIQHYFAHECYALSLR